MKCFILYSNFVVLVQNHFLSIRRTQVVERDSEEVFRRCSFAKFTEKRRKRSILKQSWRTASHGFSPKRLNRCCLSTCLA